MHNSKIDIPHVSPTLTQTFNVYDWYLGLVLLTRYFVTGLSLICINEEPPTQCNFTSLLQLGVVRLFNLPVAKNFFQRSCEKHFFNRLLLRHVCNRCQCYKSSECLATLYTVKTNTSHMYRRHFVHVTITIHYYIDKQTLLSPLYALYNLFLMAFMIKDPKKTFH